MRMPMAWTIGLSLLALAAGPAAAADTPPAPALADTAAAPTADHGDLSGVWILNEKASDDPAAVMRRNREQGGMGRGGMGRRGGRGDRQGMGGDERPDALQGRGQFGSSEGGGQDRDRTMQRRIARLAIFSDGPEFDVTDGLDITRVLHTDGRTETVWTEHGEQQATAAWMDGVLEVRWQGRRGPGRVTRYALEGDGAQLVVLEQVQMPGSKDAVTLRLVYDRQPPAEPAGGDGR